ncbi:MAG: FAD-dependent oxidoreductase [Lentisphaeria bacterium]|nr:FAD-dependent oxidoreductase [Lentisphaeria bacterium]
MRDAMDVLVVGGGLAGCLAAVRAAEQGRSVVVIEKRAYLGREISACNHTFVACQADDGAFRRCPEPFRRLFRAHGHGEILAPEGMTRQHLLAILEEQGIPVLFEAEPVAATVADGQATGLLLACPSGLAWLPGRAILDASENANLLRLLADRSSIEAGSALVHAVFEMGLPSKSDLPEDTELAGAEKALALVPGSLRLHPTLRNDAVVIEYAYQAETSGERGLARSRLETAARQKSVDAALFLKTSVSAFAQASLSHLAYECHVAQPDSPVPASPCPNLATAPALSWGFSLEEVADSAAQIDTLLARLPSAPAAAVGGTVRGCGKAVELADLAPEPADDDALPVPLFLVTRPAALQPAVRLSCEVCVAGVGTGGGMAMLSAAERGGDVVALEVNRDLGGTHTTGGVVGYYAGYQGGASAAAIEEAKRLNPGQVVGSSPGGLSHAELLRRKAASLGVRLLTGTRICGAVVQDGRLVQVLAANEDGLLAIAAKVSIDATGDGDLAAQAGARYQIGDPHDGMVQSYSMWGKDVYPSPSFLAQRYLTDPGLFHPDVYSERLRAIAVAHRGNSPHHISPMLTPREARRIEGDYALTMADILTQRVFPDALAVACTQTDSHAFASSDFDRLGGAGGGSPLHVRIPYGCFIPKGIEGLLVAAKAISGERDATCFCRMNADIKNAGYALGLAALAAAKAGCGVRDINLPELQKELKQLGILPDWAFAAAKPADRLDAALAALPTGGFAALQRVLYFPAREALPPLEARYAQLADQTPADPFHSERAQLCLALAWHGSALGADFLAALLEQAIAEQRHTTLPHLRAFRMGVAAGGKGEDDYTLVNRLLVMAGRSGGREVIAPLARLIADLPGLGEPVPHVMPYDRERKDIVAYPFFSRLRNVAYAVERQADPALVPALETLLAREGLTGHAVPVGAAASPRYMLAHLELWLARAAARCGSRTGAAILVRYLDDTHVFFRRHARRELANLAGADQPDWSLWLAHTPVWDPRPYRPVA